MDKKSTFRMSEIMAMGPDELYKIASKDLKIPMASAMGDVELRNAVIGHARADGVLVDDVEPGKEPPARPANRDAPAATPPAPQRPVIAAYPPHEGEWPQLVGRTVAYAFDALRDAYSIHPDARVYVNDEVITDRKGTTLKAGDRIEFSRPAGEKA